MIKERTYTTSASGWQAQNLTQTSQGQHAFIFPPTRKKLLCTVGMVTSIVWMKKRQQGQFTISATQKNYSWCSWWWPFSEKQSSSHRCPLSLEGPPIRASQPQIHLDGHHFLTWLWEQLLQRMGILSPQSSFPAGQGEDIKLKPSKQILYKVSLRRVQTASTLWKVLPGKFRVPLSANGSLGGFLFVPCGQSTHSLWVERFHGWPDTDDEAWLCPLGCFSQSSCRLFCNHLTAATLGIRLKTFMIFFSLFSALYFKKSVSPNPGSFL